MQIASGIDGSGKAERVHAKGEFGMTGVHGRREKSAGDGTGGFSVARERTAKSDGLVREATEVNGRGRHESENLSLSVARERRI